MNVRRDQARLHRDSHKIRNHRMPFAGPRTSRFSRRWLKTTLLAFGLAGNTLLAVDPPDLTDGFTPPEIAPGAPAGSYALSGFDTINYYTGRLNFALPLRTIGGRGEVGHTITLQIDMPWTVDIENPTGWAQEENPLPAWWNTTPVGLRPRHHSWAARGIRERG